MWRSFWGREHNGQTYQVVFKFIDCLNMAILTGLSLWNVSVFLVCWCFVLYFRLTSFDWIDKDWFWPNLFSPDITLCVWLGSKSKHQLLTHYWCHLAWIKYIVSCTVFAYFLFLSLSFTFYYFAFDCVCIISMVWNVKKCVCLCVVLFKHDQMIFNPPRWPCG